MSFYVLNQISTLSILIACVIGVARFSSIPQVYRPFLFFIWIGTGNEAISYFFVMICEEQNTINSNIYGLIEYLLILLQFYRWNMQGKAKNYLILCVLGCMLWLMDNLILHSIGEINSLFRVFYSFTVAVLAIQQLRKLIDAETRALIRNSMFQVSMCFVFYFSYKTLIETFYVLHPPFSRSFNLNLFSILLFVNLFSNIVYAVALIWMPSKRKFSLH